MNTYFTNFNRILCSLLVICLIFLVNGALLAQHDNNSFFSKKLTNITNKVITDNFADFTIVELEIDRLNNLVRPQNRRSTQNDAPSIHLQMGDYDWEFDLYPTSIFTEDFQLITIKNGRRIEIPINKNKTYAGYLKGTNDEVRLTIDDNFLSGVIYQNGKSVYIEPLSRFKADARPNQLIIYETKL